MSTATVVPNRTRTGGVSSPRLLARTCATEWTRLWTVRATWLFLAAAAVTMIGIGAAAGLDAATDPPAFRGNPAWPAATLTAMPGQFFLLALALSAVTADYATGGIVPTLQWTPRRGVLFVARSVVAVAVATASGVLLGLGSALAAFAAARGALSLPAEEVVETLGTVAVVISAGTALAVGLGFLLRSTAGGLVAVFLLMLVLPLLLPGLGFDWTMAVAERLPGTGAAFLLLGEVGGLTTTSAVVTMLVWAAVAVLLGAVRLVRDDANR